MKTALFSIVLLICIVGQGMAGPNNYIGLYADDMHSECSVTVSAPSEIFTVWVWALPSDEGMICAEYAMNIPTYIFITGTVTQPTHTLGLDGCTTQRCSVCFGDCQYDWLWFAQFTMMSMQVIADEIQIISHPDVGFVAAAVCSEGYPIVPLVILNHLAINQPCVIGAESHSWGAIKTLFSE